MKSKPFNAKPRSEQKDISEMNPSSKLNTLLLMESFGTDLDDYKSFAEFEKNMIAIGAKKIGKLMDDYKKSPYFLFPSAYTMAVQDTQWPDKSKGEEYPKILAEALIQSKNAESLTDIANIYYSRDRKASKGAIDVWKKHALQDGGFQDGYTFMDLVRDTETRKGEMDGNIGDLAKKEPAFFKKWLMASFDDDEIAEITAWAPKTMAKLGMK